MKATATAEQIRDAARAIRAGRLVVFPTETVYGLGADARNADAVARIFAAKGRPSDNPLIVHVRSIDEIDGVAEHLPSAARRLFERFSPGPLTLVLPAHRALPRTVTAGLDTVAVRIPRHRVAQALLAACRCPIAAPSANRSGEPSPTTLAMARASLWRASERRTGDEEITFLEGGPCEVGLESTVASVSEGRIVILRPGFIAADELRLAVPDAEVLEAIDAAAADRPSSPGLKHGHYRPRAAVIAHDNEGESLESLLSRVFERERAAKVTVGVIGIGPVAGSIADAFAQRFTDSVVDSGVGPVPRVILREAADERDYARELYRWLVELDVEGAGLIVAVLPPDRGVGRALRDRIARAAGA